MVHFVSPLDLGNLSNLEWYLGLGYQIGPTAIVTFAHGPRYRVYGGDN